MRSIATSDHPIYHFHVIAFTQNLFKPHGPNFCPAGRSYFAVAGNGAVYPCQNLPETAHTRIGFLGEDQLLDKILNAPIRKTIDLANAHANDTLGDQWFANFCKVCPVYNLSETKSIETTAPLRTKLYEAMAAAYVKELLEISRDEERYNRFLTNVRDESEDTLELNVF
jgi:radical SAM protein with 4Fe4S-binding SPASM domain